MGVCERYLGEGALAASMSLSVSVFYCGVCVCEREKLCTLCCVAVCVSAWSSEDCFAYHTNVCEVTNSVSSYEFGTAMLHMTHSCLFQNSYGLYAEYIYM